MTSLDKEQLRQQLIRHEGLRLNPYKCPTGYLTIGCGRNLDTNGISEAEARFLLDNDIAACINDLNSFQWFFDLDGVRQRALIDMRFQLGLNGLLRFVKMLDAIRRRDWPVAQAECLDSTYATQTPGRAQENATMLETGQE